MAIGTERKRNVCFELWYALGIVFILDGHLYSPFGFATNFFPYYSFHVMMFTFASGYFYNSDDDEHPIAFLIRKAKKNLLPLFFWYAVYGIIATLLRMCGIPYGKPLTLYSLFVLTFTNGHQFVYNCPAWFVGALFVVQLATVLFRWGYWKILGKKCGPIQMFVLYFAAGVVGAWLAYNIGTAGEARLLFLRLLHFMPFFAFGYLYAHVLEKWELQHIPHLVYFGVILAIDLVIVTYYQRTLSYYQAWCRTFSEGPLMPFVVGFLGIAFWMRVCHILTPIAEKSRLVHTLSSYSFDIMMHQVMGIFCVKLVIYAFYLQGFCRGFKIDEFMSDMWYLYYPKDQKQWGAVYFICAIAFSLFVGWAQRKTVARGKEALAKMIKKQNIR